MAKRKPGPTLIQQSRRVSPEQKAIWHQVQGAGRSQVIREFVGLTDDESEAIVTSLQRALERRLDTQN